MPKETKHKIAINIPTDNELLAIILLDEKDNLKVYEYSHFTDKLRKDILEKIQEQGN